MSVKEVLFLTGILALIFSIARIKSRSQRFNINSRTVRFRWGKSWVKVFKASELLHKDVNEDEEETGKGLEEVKDNEEEDGKDNEFGTEKDCDNVDEKDNIGVDEEEGKEVTWMASGALVEVEHIVCPSVSSVASFVVFVAANCDVNP